MDSCSNDSASDVSSVPSDLLVCDRRDLYIDYSQFAFCSQSNINECLALLSEEFVSLGFPSIYPALENYSFILDCDVVKYINITYELLHLCRNSIQNKTALEERISVLCSDLDKLHSNQTQLKSSLEQSERKCANFQEKERQQTEKCRALQTQLALQKHENRKLSSLIQQQKSAYQQDLKRLERQNSQMKEKIHQLLVDKNSEKKLGTIEILNALPKKDNQRGKWKTSTSVNSHIEDMYKSIIHSYESRVQEQAKEFNSFEAILKSLQEEIYSLVSLLKEDSNFHEESSKMLSPSEIQNTLLLSKDWKRKLKENLQYEIDFIKRCIKKAQDLHGSVKSDDENAVIENIRSLKLNEDNMKVAIYSNENTRSKTPKNEKKGAESQLKEKQMFLEEKASLEDAIYRLRQEKKTLEDQKLDLLMSQIMRIKTTDNSLNCNSFFPSASYLTIEDGSLAIPNEAQFKKYIHTRDNTFSSFQEQDFLNEKHANQILVGNNRPLVQQEKVESSDQKNGISYISNEHLLPFSSDLPNWTQSISVSHEKEKVVNSSPQSNQSIFQSVEDNSLAFNCDILSADESKFNESPSSEQSIESAIAEHQKSFKNLGSFS